MLNQVVLVGRLTKDVEIKTKGEEKCAVINLAVSRSFKNADGEYETDFIDCVLWNALTERTAEYCKKGDIIGVKGRLQMTKEDDKYGVEVIAEKLTFLSSRKEDE